MNNSTRINELIFYLTNNNDFVQADELASYLHVSTKTVYRLIKKINQKNDTPLIVSQRGAGFKLNYQHYIQNKQVKKLANNSLVNISPVERRNRIMKRLLLVSPQSIKESEAFGKYYVSGNVISNDEHVMRSILSRYELKLIVKNGYIKIEGTEVNIRRAIKELIDDREIVDLKEFAGNKDFNSKYDVHFVLKEIEKIEAELQTSLPYPYNVNLFSHIYILIIRLRKSANNVKRRSVDIKKDLTYNNSLYKISKNVAKDISNYLNIKIPSDEADSIFEYLVSSRFDDDIAQEHTNKKVQHITADLIKSVSKKMGCDFSGIENKLQKHIEPLIKRLKNSIHVNNNLLGQIKMEYSDLFRIIKQASNKIFPKHGLNLPDDNEIGYITLYFAQAIETQSRRLKVVIMCATGIGTSELLQIKVTNTFPNFDVIAVTSNNDVSVENTDADLIISTVRVSDKISIPSVIVSALFTKQDQEVVKQAAKKILGNKYES